MKIKKSFSLILRKSVPSIGGMLLLAGCAVGPDFQSPEAPQTVVYTDPSFFPNELDGQKFIWGGHLKAQWWELFESPTLNQMIEKALVQNPTLQAAHAALKQAQENLNAETGSLFPALNFSGTAHRQRASTIPGSKPGVYNLYNTSVNVSYTLDLFGGIRRQIEALEAQVAYQNFLKEAAYLTLTSNIVTGAIQAASLRAQIEATQEIIQFQEKQLALAETQFYVGAVSKPDLLAQEGLLAETRAALPLLQSNLARVRHSLLVLMGRLPGDETIPSFKLEDLKLPRKVPVSLPSSFVRQRPDIRAAEALLHQASANIGVAKANFFPQLTLTGNLGSQSTTPQKLFGNSSNIWNLGAQLLQPIFRGGALTAQKRGAEAAYEEAFAHYRQAVLQGFQNVADALHALVEDSKALTHQKEAEEAAYESLKLLQEQFNFGAVSLGRVLLAEQNYQQMKIARIQAEASRYADTVALFQALGGGWWNKRND